MARLFLGRKKNRPLSKKVDDSDPPPSRIADDIRPSAGQERTAAPRLAPRRLHLLGMTQVAEPGSARAATHAEDQTRDQYPSLPPTSTQLAGPLSLLPLRRRQQRSAPFPFGTLTRPLQTRTPTIWENCHFGAFFSVKVTQNFAKGRLVTFVIDPTTRGGTRSFNHYLGIGGWPRSIHSYFLTIVSFCFCLIMMMTLLSHPIDKCPNQSCFSFQTTNQFKLFFFHFKN
jgi:hypothetical protein